MTRDSDYTQLILFCFFLKPGVVSHNAILQAISLYFFSLTFVFNVLCLFLVELKRP